MVDAYVPQDPCTDECASGRHYHLERPTPENEWADAAVQAEHPGGVWMKATSFFGEPVNILEESEATMRALLADPLRLVPVGSDDA